MKADAPTANPRVPVQRLERSFFIFATAGLLAAMLLDFAADANALLRVLIGGVAAIGSLHFSRRSPNVAAGLLLVVSFALSAGGLLTRQADSSPGLVMIGGLILLCGIISRTGERPLAAPLIVTIFVAILVADVVFAGPFAGLVATIVFWATAAAAVGAGLYLRLGAEDRERSIAEARNGERIEMARELHDVVAHHVTGIVVHAQAGQFVAETNPEHAKQILSEIEQAGTEAMASMRQLVDTLRTGDNPLDASMNARGDLNELVQTVRESGVDVNLTVNDFPTSLAPTIVRLTREALTNTRRHSPEATSINIMINSDETNLHWTVSDNGQPKAPNLNPGYGIVGMRERVESLNGQLDAGHDGAHWIVSATIPLDNAQ